MKEYPVEATSPSTAAGRSVDGIARQVAELTADLTPEQLADLRAEHLQAASVVGAGYGRWPDVGNAEVPCCMAAVNLGHQWCTCWEPVFDVEQAAPVTELTPGCQPTMCGDCAYRPKSPERQGDPDAASHTDDLMHLVVTGTAFWCHEGIRRPTHWRHPSGATVPGAPNDYKPEIVNRVPYQADGTPALLCGGWAALRRKHAQQANPQCTVSPDCRVTRPHYHVDPEGSGHLAELDEAAEGLVFIASNARRCRVCGCTDGRACNGGCSWVAPDIDLCNRCQPLEQLFGLGGADDPVDLLADNPGPPATLTEVAHEDGWIDTGSGPGWTAHHAIDSEV